MARPRGYVHRVDIHADVTQVWQALIDPVLLARWHVSDARVDARAGGSFWTRLAPKLEREAHIDVFRPPQRLRLLYMPMAGLPDTGAVPIDDFMLEPDEAATRRGAPVTVLRLIGSGIPEVREWDPMFIRLRGGWERALLRLKVMYERKPETAAGLAGAAGQAEAKGGAATTQRAKLKSAPPARPIVRPQPVDDFIPWPESTPDKKR
jgi:Activator of Hsp90 ATPase homolog 1-like protein